MKTSRNTIQRDLVLQAVQALHNHPTAEDIYAEVTKQHPRISKGTVYRNLGVLADSGKIRRVSQPGTADRFDFQLHEHYHFHCTGCGGVFDMDLPFIPDMLCRVPNTQGFDLQRYDITFSGLCPQCKPQKNQAS